MLPEGKPQFIYYLKPDNTHYYHLLNGVVSVAATAMPLAHAPLEWKTTDLQWGRNTKYHGIFRTFVVPMSFVEDGAAILRYVFWTQGYEGKCIIDIRRLNTTTHQYDAFYVGDIDFGQINDTYNSFAAKVVDKGLATILQANESTPYELPIQSGSSIKAYFDGVTVQSDQAWIVPKNTTAYPLVNRLQLVPTLGEGYNTGTQNTVTPNTANILRDLNADFCYEATVAQNVTVQFSGLYINWFWPGSETLNAKPELFIRYGQAGAGQHDQLIWSPSNMIAPGSSATWVIPTVSFSFTMSPGSPGDRLAVYFVIRNSIGGLQGTTTNDFNVLGDNGRMDLFVEFLTTPSTVPFKRYAQVWDELIDKMTDGQYPSSSTLLNTPSLSLFDNKPWNTLVTCGDALRKLTQNSTGAIVDPSIVITLDQLLKDSLGQWMAGIGTDGDIARLEQLSYFYNDSVITAELGGEIANPLFEIASEYLFNVLKVGYPKQDYDKLNGRDGFNLTTTYAVPVLSTAAKKELDMVSDWYADMYALEYIRANIGNKRTTDSKNDNDTFLVEIGDTTNSNGAYLLARKQNGIGNSASGLINSSTTYNLSLTNGRKVRRTGPYLHSSLYSLDGKDISFQTADKNADVVSNLGTGTITEGAPIPISSLGNKLFLPIYFSFDTMVPTNIADLIAANPYGKIGVIYNGYHFYGFISRAGIRPADNAVYQWKLLLAPGTDLTKLIYIRH